MLVSTLTKTMLNQFQNAVYQSILKRADAFFFDLLDDLTVAGHISSPVALSEEGSGSAEIQFSLQLRMSNWILTGSYQPRTNTNHKTAKFDGSKSLIPIELKQKGF